MWGGVNICISMFCNFDLFWNEIDKNSEKDNCKKLPLI